MFTLFSRFVLSGPGFSASAVRVRLNVKALKKIAVNPPVFFKTITPIVIKEASGRAERGGPAS